MNNNQDQLQRDNASKCPYCKESNIIEDREIGESVCSNCGLVVTNTLMDTGPEYRVFNQQDTNRKRAGAGYSITSYDKGLSTVIKGNRDASGKLLDNETALMMRRLQKTDNRSKVDETQTRNLSLAMSELDRMGSELHLPKNVKDNAALIYRKTLNKDLIRGRSIDAFVAASLYASCRLYKVPRPLKEVSRISKRSHSEVATTYRLIHKELNLKPPTDTPYKFIPSIASDLRISQQIEQRAVEILRHADEVNELVGKNPRGLAAAALYMACKESDEKRPQRAVSKAAGTTEVTIRNRVKGLKEALNEREQDTPVAFA